MTHESFRCFRFIFAFFPPLFFHLANVNINYESKISALRHTATATHDNHLNAIALSFAFDSLHSVECRDVGQFILTSDVCFCLLHFVIGVDFKRQERTEKIVKQRKNCDGKKSAETCFNSSSHRARAFRLYFGFLRSHFAD